MNDQQNEIEEIRHEELADSLKQMLQIFGTGSKILHLKTETRTVKLEDDAGVSIKNTDELGAPIKEFSASLGRQLAEQHIEILEALQDNKPQPEDKQIEQGIYDRLAEVKDAISGLADKEINITVDAPAVHVKAPKLESVAISNWPTKPAQALPVVLTDDSLNRFYNATLTALAGSGGIQSTLIKESTATPGQNAVVVVNPDGSNVSGGSGSGSAAYSDSGGTDRKGLVDADRHVQADIVGPLPAGTNNIGDVDVVSSALPTGASTSAKQDTIIGHLDGVEGLLTTIDGDTGILAGAVSGSEMQVDVVGPLPAGTNAIGKLAANSGVDIGDVDVTSAIITGGAVADDATTPGNPLMIGGQAKESDGTDPGSVSAEDDVARAIFDRNRRQYVNTAHPNLWKVFEDHTSAQTNNQLKGAPGSNLSLYITDIIYSNGATAGSIKLVEDEGGTPVQLTQTVYMAINGGAVMHFETPIRLTANKTLGFTSTGVTTHSVEVHGYIAP